MELLEQDTSICEEVSRYLTEDFVLFDIGCSGGIDSQWHAFGERLAAFGFDPVLAEIKRLIDLNEHPGVAYHSGMVCGNGIAIPPTSNPWNRLAVCATSEFRSRQAKVEKDFQGIRDNDWQVESLCEDKIKIPNFVKNNNISHIDFIKIDVDGDDYDILLSIKDLLRSHDVMGLMIEINYVGSSNENENTFHNVDRFMRECGFELFDITKRLYSGSALPSSYEISIPAQGTNGRPLQGDALYFRDVCAEGYLEPEKLSFDKLLKLVALFSLFGKYDSCAEIFLKFRSKFEDNLEIGSILNKMVKVAYGGRYNAYTYDELILKFESDDPMFYPE